MMQEVIQFLKHKGSFQDGVQLYHKYGNNHQIKLLLAKGETRHTTEFLYKELNKLTGIKPKLIETINPVTDSFPKSITDHYITGLNERWKPLYKEMQNLRAKLSLFATNEERGKAALNILRLEKACSEIWTFRDHYVKTGIKVSTDVNKILYLSPLDAANKLQTNKRMRLHYNAKLKKDPNNVNALKQLARINSELLVLSNFLSDDATKL